MEQLLTDQIILITGATSGIGRFSAIRLAQMGATVVVLARNEEKFRQLVFDFEKMIVDGCGIITMIACDLSSMGSVVRAVQIFREKYSRIDILINNAGVFNVKRRLSKDGIEETFQVNVLAPLLIFKLLESMLLECKAKIINTSSSFHHGTIHFSNIEGRHFYSGLNAYRQSKLAGILMMKKMNLYLKDTGTQIFCQHPGVVRTNLGRSNSRFFNMGLRLVGKSVSKGSECLLYLASSPASQLVSGEFYAYRRIWKTKPQSNNKQLAEELMEVAMDYIKPFINGK